LSKRQGAAVIARAYALTERTNTDENRRRFATSRDVPDDGLLEAKVIICDILYSNVRTSEESVSRNTRQVQDRPVHLRSRSMGRRTAEDVTLFPHRIMWEPGAWMPDPTVGAE
jgi:hypothetical protein